MKPALVLVVLVLYFVGVESDYKDESQETGENKLGYGDYRKSDKVRKRDSRTRVRDRNCVCPPNLEELLSDAAPKQKLVAKRLRNGAFLNIFKPNPNNLFIPLHPDFWKEDKDRLWGDIIKKLVWKQLWRLIDIIGVGTVKAQLCKGRPIEGVSGSARRFAAVQTLWKKIWPLIQTLGVGPVQARLCGSRLRAIGGSIDKSISRPRSSSRNCVCPYDNDVGVVPFYDGEASEQFPTSANKQRLGFGVFAIFGSLIADAMARLVGAIKG